MQPDFSKKTIDILAKRAAYLCSNPDCRVSTVGPNSEDAEAIIIGEAAHIHAARADQARYNGQMTDQARSEISNAIWLCRNCHKQIDRDPSRFSANVLFIWRKRHEEYVSSALGSQTDKIQFDIARHELKLFDGYPPLIWRIAYDKPPAWEWSLTAALMRHLNAPLFRKLSDLRDGVCALQIQFLNDDEVVEWARDRVREMAEMVEPLTKIVDRINKAWGEPGEPGDVEEIHHATLLLRDSLAKIVKYEEQIASVRVEPQFETVISYLKDALGSQVEKFKRMPEWLDEIVEMAVNFSEDDAPIVVTRTIEFDLPEQWAEDFSETLSMHINAQISRKNNFLIEETPKKSFGCFSWLLIAVVIWMIFQIL